MRAYSFATGTDRCNSEAVRRDRLLGRVPGQLLSHGKRRTSAVPFTAHPDLTGSASSHRILHGPPASGFVSRSARVRGFGRTPFKAIGFTRITLRRYNKDDGVDIIAILASSGAPDETVLVEVKHGKRGIGLAVVDRLNGVRSRLNADRALAVTSAHVTSDARIAYRGHESYVSIRTLEELYSPFCGIQGIGPKRHMGFGPRESRRSRDRRTMACSFWLVGLATADTWRYADQKHASNCPRRIISRRALS